MLPFTEEHLIEQPAIQLMEHGLSWNEGGWKIFNDEC